MSLRNAPDPRYPHINNAGYDYARAELHQIGFANVQEKFAHLLAEYAKRSSESDEKDAFDVIGRDRVHEFFGAMVNSLRNALWHIIDKTSRDRFRFYFWPGYEVSPASASRSRRLTLSFSHGETDVPSGCGYSGLSICDEPPGLDTLTDHMKAQTALWYSRALDTHENDGDESLNLKPFVPGGTHAWASIVALYFASPAVNDQTSRERPRSLTHLEIRCVDSPEHEEAFQTAENVKAGRISLALPSHSDSSDCGFECEHCSKDCPKWAGIIARGLQERALDLKLPKELTRWPFAPDDKRESSEKKTIKNIRLRLYEIWLAATLGDFSLEHFRRILQSTVDYLGKSKHLLPDLNLDSLSRRLQFTDTDETIESQGYRCWYTLPIEPTIDRLGEVSPLGSAMILTSHTLPIRFLYMVSTWAFRMYSEMRRFEDLAREEKYSRRSEATRKRQAFAHAIKGFIAPISGALESIPSESTKAANSAIRQLHFHANAFDVLPFQLAANPSDLEWNTCVNDALELTVARLSQRCQEGAKSLDNYLTDKEEINTELRLELNSPRYLLSWGDDIDALLEFVCPDGLGAGLSGFRTIWADEAESGFYTYLLTQALYHGAVCAIYDERFVGCRTGSYVTVQYDSDSQTAAFRSRAFEPVAGYSETNDGRTVKAIKEKMDARIPGWLSIDPRPIAVADGWWFEVAITYSKGRR